MKDKAERQELKALGEEEMDEEIEGVFFTDEVFIIDHGLLKTPLLKKEKKILDFMKQYS